MSSPDFHARPSRQLLSSQQSERIHRASSRLLETAGGKVHLPEAYYQDIEKAARLCDYLPNIDFIMPMGMAAGVDPVSRGIEPKVTDRYDFAAMLGNTTKPLMCSCWTVEGLTNIREMASAVRSGEQALRERVRRILDNHRPERLPGELEKRIEAMLQRAGGQPILNAPG